MNKNKYEAETQYPSEKVGAQVKTQGRRKLRSESLLHWTPSNTVCQGSLILRKMAA